MAEENKLNQTPEITPAPSAEAPEKAPTTGELLGDVEAVDDAAEEAAAACLKGRTLADEIAALAALTVEDANALLQTALREENRAYVQIDPAEK